MKVTLSEIKKNTQGTNSGRDETKNQINDLEHKEEKKNSIRTARKKRIPRKSEDSISSLWDTFKCTTLES